MVTRLTDYTKQFWILLSTDDMDTLGSHNGDEAIVIDQDKRYVFDEDYQTWHQIPMSGGGGSGSDPYSIARSIVDRSITEYIDPNLTVLGERAFYGCRSLTTLQVHGVKRVTVSCIEGAGVTSLALPSIDTVPPNVAYGNCPSLLRLDYGEQLTAFGRYALPFPNLQTLVLRRSESLVSGSSLSFNGTPMKQGGAGVTVYIPKSLYDHLGDGSALDYKNATDWSVYDAYGTITWAQIEGSIYETQYADGTPIA